VAVTSLFTLVGVAMADPAAKSADDAVDPPHPLAAAYPGKLVVVCEAGCPRHRGPEIVFMERIPQRRTAAVVGMMQPTSAHLDDTPLASSGVIECLAGCYDTPKFYKSPIIPTRPLGLGGTAFRSTLPADPEPRKREPFSPVR
jgi:hypothetical protein